MSAAAALVGLLHWVEAYDNPSKAAEWAYQHADAMLAAREGRMSERRYGAWAGAPNGYREDPSRCVVEVPVGGRSVLFRQCLNRRTAGLELCAPHARQQARGRHLHIPAAREGR